MAGEGRINFSTKKGVRRRISETRRCNGGHGVSKVVVHWHNKFCHVPHSARLTCVKWRVSLKLGLTFFIS